jgi:hypothetical protein
MSEARLGPGLTEALHGDMVPKFLATRDAAGTTNVVPIISLDADDDHTLMFGAFLIQKTRSNLLADPRAAACVVTEDLRAWTVRLRFRGFEQSGDRLDRMNRRDMFRYNAYLGVRQVGVLDLEEVGHRWSFSRASVAAELLPVRAASLALDRRGARRLPPRVSDKLDRMQAIKVVSWLGPDGHPRIAPAFSLCASKSDTLLFGTRLARSALAELEPGTRVAAAVITTDPVAYQVKGVFEGSLPATFGTLGRIRVEQAYSASPPLCGEPIGLQSRDPARLRK